MPDPRIIDIELDERSILKRNADIEQERRIAIFDLIEQNSFAVAGHDGPYRVRLRVEEGRLAIELLGEDGARCTRRSAWASPASAARSATISRSAIPISARSARDGAKGIEAIDMARRGLHNEAAELLQECLDGKVEMDFDTARRLFTLICVLHIKQSTTAVDLHGPGPASRAGMKRLLLAFPLAARRRLRDERAALRPVANVRLPGDGDRALLDARHRRRPHRACAQSTGDGEQRLAARRCRAPWTASASWRLGAGRRRRDHRRSAPRPLRQRGPAAARSCAIEDDVTRHACARTAGADTAAAAGCSAGRRR